MERFTELHAGVPVIKDKDRHKEAMARLHELEECDTVKKPRQNIFDEDSMTCICGSDFDKDAEFRFCPWCGQRLLRDGDGND